MKTYKAKSSAKRAALKEHGLDAFDYGKLEQNEQGYYFKVKPVAKAKPVVAMPKKRVAKVKPPTGIKSTADSPCRTVWCIAGDMGESAKRKDVIEECVKQGVNFYTARTQYQRYKEALKNAANELKVAPIVVNTKKELVGA